MARTKQTARKSAGGAAPRRDHLPPPTSLADILAVAELAENVLAQLPMKDLLLVQRVSKRWMALIQSSPRLQELLFMRPKCAPADEAAPCESNPLLAEKMPLWFPEHADMWGQSIRDLPWTGTASRLAFLCKGASWRRMLVAQPALKVFELVHQRHARAGDWLSVGCLELPDGVRMGMVYDIAAGNEDFLPHGFPDSRALIGGRAAPKKLYECGVPIGEEPSESGLQRYSDAERIFGGADRFTLITKRSYGCNMGIYDREIVLSEECQQYLSSEREQVAIELSQIDKPEGPGRSWSWWTRDGYRKAGS